MQMTLGRCTLVNTATKGGCMHWSADGVSVYGKGAEEKAWLRSETTPVNPGLGE